MADFPLLFRLTYSVKIGGSPAVVVANGRILVNDEDGIWWCRGVEPGGVMEESSTPKDACSRFILQFTSALDDLAEGSDGLESFEREARMLFETDKVEAARWETAQASFSADRVEEPFFRSLKPWERTPSFIAVGMAVTYAGAKPDEQQVQLLKAA
jgi:hypothetical protein